MPKNVVLTLSPKQAADTKVHTALAARSLGVSDRDIALIRIIKRSVDARRGQPKVILTLEVYIDREPQPEPLRFDYPDVSTRTPVIIVGAGPAGLFAALRLIEAGFRPLLLERGREVSPRKRDIAIINRNGTIDPDSNYAFGEGGAGTFSDGKLFTRSKKRGDYNRVLQTLVFHGAAPEILYEAHPHIGSDRLPRIVSNIRQTILDAGGEVCFNKRVTALKIKDNRVLGVYCGDELIEGAAVVLATGHSADDIYMMLHDAGVLLEAKPFAMGVRAEHPQQLINAIQYRRSAEAEYLPAASYSLVTQVAGRGVYSFCMCPGGFMVPAMTDASQSVVNGMSPGNRNSPFANSGIVTEVRLSDFAHLVPQYGALAGLAFRREVEQAAKRNGGAHQTAPAQRITDFVAGRRSHSLPRVSYIPGVAPTDFGAWLPQFMRDALKGGFIDFGRKMHGYLTDEGIIAGVESRTSTPVRIPRDPATLMHPQTAGLFPAGEGAGYAGGIVSAALDGTKIADAITQFLISN